MNVNTFFIIIAIILIIYINYEIRKEKLSIADSMFWLFGCIIILLLSLFPNVIISVSDFVGIEYAPSLLFLVGIIGLLALNFSQVKRISKLEEKINDLAQNFAILKNKLNDQKMNEDKKRSDDN